MVVSDVAIEKKVPQLFGHPIGLTYLFGTEMWERFSYYGMRVLLPLYLMQYLLLPGHAEHVVGFDTVKHLLEGLYGPLNDAQQLKSAIYGAYTGLVYATPLLGGYLADRYFGRRYTVVVGGLLMAIGHFLMAFENYFYFALLFLIVGNGGFKPNISTQVGGLYKPGDNRIDRAYSVFYVGINLGAMLGQNICDMLGEGIAWRWGFTAAGVAMLLGTLIYLFALRILPYDRPKKATADAPRPPLNKYDWRAVLILLLLFIPGCLFWATYEQSGNTVETWSTDHLNRVVALGSWSFSIPIGTIQSVNSVFILAFTPLVIMFWQRQEKRGREPSAITKMAIGLLVLSFSYLILAAAQFSAGGGQVHWIWSIVYFAVFTIGELYFSPVGLSLYAKAAPPQLAALLMGVFLATSFPGNFLAGYLGKFYSTMPPAHFFVFIAIIAAAPAPIIWLFNRPVRTILKHREERQFEIEKVPYQIPIE